MNDVIFVILICFYFWAAYKIEYWLYISWLGFNIETPIFFVQKTGFYSKSRGVIFLIAIALSFFTELISVYLSLILVVFTWVYSGILGRRKAFKRYRKIFAELALKKEDKTERMEYFAIAQRTDRELQEEVNNRIKQGF